MTVVSLGSDYAVRINLDDCVCLWSERDPEGFQEIMRELALGTLRKCEERVAYGLVTADRGVLLYH